MIPTTTDSLRKRFLDAEIQFLAVRDSAALEAFSTNWSVLCDDFERVADSVDPSLAILVHSIASKLPILCDTLVELSEETREMTQEYVEEVDSLLANLSINDLAHTLPESSQPLASTRRLSQHPRREQADISPPTLIAPAYNWLLLNLHNPYPSAAVKKSFVGRMSRITSRTIDDWFKSLRRHIGWVSLCKRHFRGSRSLAIIAAERMFSDAGHDVDLPFELAADFLDMKSKLENMYVSEASRLPASYTSELCVATSSPDAATSSPNFPFTPISVTIGPISGETAEFWPNELFETSFSQHLTPSRPPSLVFSSSDSDEEDRLTDFPSQNSFDDALVWPENVVMNGGDLEESPTECWWYVDANPL